MSLIPFIGKALKTAASLLGAGSPDASVLERAVEVVERVRATPEGRAALDEHEREMKALSIEELKVVMSESLAMIQSEDKYVSRSRPTGLYIFYLCVLGLTTSLILGAKVDPVAIMTLITPLAGVGGYYVHSRTREKMNGNGYGS